MQCFKDNLSITTMYCNTAKCNSKNIFRCVTQMHEKNTNTLILAIEEILRLRDTFLLCHRKQNVAILMICFIFKFT